MQTYEPQRILLASAIWMIFAVGIIFSSPPAPGERGPDTRISDTTGHRATLAAFRRSSGEAPRSARGEGRVDSVALSAAE